ncbi:Zn-ribbon domain-containing OB-fold protein [Candidatus Thorarchaeota archaeon]|nr:MAG: Zn-ribbon domain-containing OB-fold protein [Candidatus Thorarchaeota archaeon]
MAEKGVAQVWRRFDSIYNLIGTHCSNCGTYYFPPRLVCPKCRRKGKLEEYKYKGLGKIHTFSIVRQAPENFKRQVPYVVAQVQLDEGPRLTAQIVNIDPEDVKIGMRVRVCFRKITEYGEGGIIVYGYKFEPTMIVTGHE